MTRLALALAACLAASAAAAATVSYRPVNKRFPEAGSLEIVISGDIVSGDAERFRRAYAEALATGRPVRFVNLNSPGGSLQEGIELARAVRASGLTTVVGTNDVCASACFLPFAAGSLRLVNRGARIGVHGAAENGLETGAAALGTIGMARLAAEFGASPEIVGRMVVTPPSRMLWLGESELLTMTGPRGQVRILAPGDDWAVTARRSIEAERPRP